MLGFFVVLFKDWISLGWFLAFKKTSGYGSKKQIRTILVLGRYISSSNGVWFFEK
jgi:hypothetical protein